MQLLALLSSLKWVRDCLNVRYTRTHVNEMRKKVTLYREPVRQSYANIVQFFFSHFALRLLLEAKRSSVHGFETTTCIFFPPLV